MLRLLSLFARAAFQTLFRRLRHGPTRPSWPFSFELVVCFLRLDYQGSSAWPIQRLRADLERRPIQGKAITRVSREQTVVGGVACERFVPRDVALLNGTIVYLHGGSYLFGSAQTHADIIARLASGTERAVLVPAYRLAPEHPYPAQRDDALAVIAGLVEAGIAPADIVLVGDSAGGHQAIAAQIARRDAGEAQVAAVAALSPWVDPAGSFPSRQACDDVDWGSAEMLRRHARLAFGANEDLADPSVALVSAPLAGLAPLLVVTGDAEALYDENLAFVARAREAGASAELCVLRDMPHNGPIFAEQMPEGARGLAAVVAYLRARLAHAAT